MNNRIERNTRAIVAQFGSWWHAVLFAFDAMSQSVFPRATTERRLAGEPVYPDSDEVDAISYDDPDEWRQAGGKRIVAGRILKHAETITGADWSIVTLALHDDPVDRGLAMAGVGNRIAEKLNLPRVYTQAVCRRWGEKRFNKRHEGAVSREYRISHYDTVAELQAMLGASEATEWKRRAEITELLEASFIQAKDRLDQA